VSAQEIIEEIKHLPAAERAQVTKFVVESNHSKAENRIAPTKQPDFLARAKKIWGDKPAGKPLSELARR
jgi:hypothetical protein